MDLKYVKEFLRNSDIQDLIDREDLEGVYSHCGSPEDLTAFLVEKCQLTPQDIVDYFVTKVPKDFMNLDKLYLDFSVLAFEFSIVLPNSIENIQQGAFYDSKLTEITLNKGLVYIGGYSFSFTQLKRVRIPETVKYIGDCAFEECKNLEEVVIEEGVKSLEDYCFSGCENLKSITLPRSIERINQSFINCPNLIIKCHKGSYARNYAARKGIPFEII